MKQLTADQCVSLHIILNFSIKHSGVLVVGLKVTVDKFEDLVIVALIETLVRHALEALQVVEFERCHTVVVFRYAFNFLCEAVLIVFQGVSKIRDLVPNRLEEHLVQLSNNFSSLIFFFASPYALWDGQRVYRREPLQIRMLPISKI